MRKAALVSPAVVSAERCRRSLVEFLRQSWPMYEPSHPFVGGRHIDAICEHLQAVSAGQIRRLLINIPPRCSKSSIVSIAYPAWEWIHRPQTRFLTSSYGMDLAIRDAVRSRRLISSPWYQARYGDRFALVSDQNQKSRYENDRTGYRIATSPSAGTTGESGDVLIVDDPHNIADVSSPSLRNATIEWWRQAMSNRHNNPRTGASILIGQRSHEQDLFAALIGDGGWDVLCLPMEYDSSRRSTTSIGFTDWRTEEGELLQADRFGRSEVDMRRHGMGEMVYQCQYNQRPTKPGGAFFRDEWFGSTWAPAGDFYRIRRWAAPVEQGPVIVEPRRCLRFITADTAATAKTSSDWTAICVWDLSPAGDLILLHVERVRLEVPDVKKLLRRLYHQWKAAWVAIEFSASGIGIVQDLRDTEMVIRPITPQSEMERALGAKSSIADKVARASIAQVRCEAGKIYVPHDKPEWWPSFHAEILAFSPEMTHGHDDQVDAFAYGAMEARARSHQMTQPSPQALPQAF